MNGKKRSRWIESFSFRFNGVDDDFWWDKVWAGGSKIKVICLRKLFSLAIVEWAPHKWYCPKSMPNTMIQRCLPLQLHSSCLPCKLPKTPRQCELHCRAKRANLFDREIYLVRPSYYYYIFSMLSVSILYEHDRNTAYNLPQHTLTGCQRWYLTCIFQQHCEYILIWHIRCWWTLNICDSWRQLWSLLLHQLLCLFLLHIWIGTFHYRCHFFHIQNFRSTLHTAQCTNFESSPLVRCANKNKEKLHAIQCPLIYFLFIYLFSCEAVRRKMRSTPTTFSSLLVSARHAQSAVGTQRIIFTSK